MTYFEHNTTPTLKNIIVPNCEYCFAELWAKFLFLSKNIIKFGPYNYTYHKAPNTYKYY